MAKLTKYLVTAPVTLGAGAVLGLSAEQAAARGHALEAVGDNAYRACALVHFKRGETIGYEGPLPKGLADDLEAIEKARKKSVRAEAAGGQADAADGSADSQADAADGA